MQRMALAEFLGTYDLDDKGVNAVTRDDEGLVWFVFELFHCDDPMRNDEAKEYRLTATFRPQDVDVHDGEFRHEEGEWLGTVLDLQASPAALRIDIEWRGLARDDFPGPACRCSAGRFGWKKPLPTIEGHAE